MQSSIAVIAFFQLISDGFSVFVGVEKFRKVDMSFPHLDKSIFRPELEQYGDRTRLKDAFLIVVSEAASLLFDSCFKDCSFVLDNRPF